MKLIEQGKNINNYVYFKKNEKYFKEKIVDPDEDISYLIYTDPQKYKIEENLINDEKKNLQLKVFKENIVDPIEGISYSIYSDPKKKNLDKHEENKIKEKYLKEFLQPEEFFREINKGEKIDLENDFHNSKLKIIKEVKSMYLNFYDKNVGEYKATIREVLNKIKMCNNIGELIKFFLTLWTGEHEKFYKVLNGMLCDEKIKFKEVSLSMYIISLNYNCVEAIQNKMSYQFFEKLYRTDRILNAKNFKKEDLFVNNCVWATTKRSDIQINKKSAKSYIEIYPCDESNNGTGFFSYLDISKISKIEKEEEVLFLPFCQFRVKEVVENKSGLDNIVLLQMEGMYSIAQNFYLVHKVKLCADRFKEPKRIKYDILILDELFKNCLKNEVYNHSYCYLKGINHFKIGDLTLAKQFLEKAIKIANKIGLEDSLYKAKNCDILGRLLDEQEKYEEAYEYYCKSLQINKNILGKEHLDTAISYNNIGGLLKNQRKYNEAYQYCCNSLDIARKKVGEDHPYTAIYYNNVGELLEIRKEYEKAYDFYWKSTEIKKKIFGEEHPDIASNYINIGSLLFNQRKYEESYNFYWSSLEIYRKILGEKHPKTANSYNNLANLFFKIGEYNKAYENIKKAFIIFKNTRGDNHSSTKNAEGLMKHLSFILLR